VKKLIPVLLVVGMLFVAFASVGCQGDKKSSTTTTTTTTAPAE